MGYETEDVPDWELKRFRGWLGNYVTDDHLADAIMDGIARYGEGLRRSEMQAKLGLDTTAMDRGVAQGIARGSFDLTSTMRLVWDE